MTAAFLKVLGTEVTQALATSFNGATLIRVYNQNGADVVLTIVDADATSNTVTIKAGAVEFIRKDPAGTIAAATSCKMVPVAF